MRVSPVKNSVNLSFLGASISALKIREDDNEQTKPQAFRVYTNADNLMYSHSVNDKRKARQIMSYQLSTTVSKEISERTRERYKEEIQAMQKGIADMCISYDEYNGKGFNYSKTLEHFFDWHGYVEENKDRLSDLMNAPYQIAQEERVSINAYAEKHPDDPKNEILQSSLFKMYELIRLNKPARTHFHD